MDINIALVAVVLMAGALLAVARLLEAHQRASRGIPVIRQVYPRQAGRRHRRR